MTNTVRRGVITAGIGAVLLLGGWWWRSPLGGRPVAVTVGEVIEAVYGLGTITAEQTFVLKLGVAATVKQLFVREGDQVTAGTPLVAFDAGLIVRAPFAGTITARPVQVGETIFPQTPVLTVTDLTQREVTILLEQEGALRVRPGVPVRMSGDVLRGAHLTGTVRAIYPRDGQFVARIAVDALPAMLLPGMTVDAAIVLAERVGALQVPVAALRDGTVMVQRGGRPLTVPVTRGVAMGAMVEIVGGLLADDVVLIP